MANGVELSRWSDGVLATLCLGCWQAGQPVCPGQEGRKFVPSYSPELIQIMRAALDEVMTKVPLEQATPGIKAALAEYILKAAAEGETDYANLVAAGADQIHTLLSI
jgi:hypothetical protein